MIRLTVNPNSIPKEHTFKQTSVTIGSAADLALPNEDLQEVHVKISEQNGQFIAINVANDPFTLINSLPFGKRTLQDADLLQIGDTTIKFECSVTIASDEEVLQSELEELFRQVENLDQVTPTPIPKVTEPPIVPVQEKVEELIPIAAAKEPPHEVPPDPAPIVIADKKQLSSWRFLGFICVFLVFFMGFSGTIIYVKIRDRNEEQKVKAAESLADIAMALTYAQVYHLKPQEQDWSSPIFLKNNLASVLSSEYPSFANIDAQGNFKNCPYILRIYTGSSLSKFIVIAQPAPTLLQWLAPKPAIIIDSKAMELRSMHDLKGLNRLLVDSNTLDGIRAAEISRLIQEGGLISLAELGAKRGFLPPKALKLLRPNAENYIYNAPRYYHFGDALLKRTVAWLQNGMQSEEKTRLQQQLLELAKLPNLVLYSSQGIQKAMQAQQALAAMVPLHKFLIAYLNFNHRGIVVSSHLLMDNPTLFTSRPSPSHLSGIIAERMSKEEKMHGRERDLKREGALKPLSDELVLLLQENTRHPISGFPVKAYELFKQYLELHQEYETIYSPEGSLAPSE